MPAQKTMPGTKKTPTKKIKEKKKEKKGEKKHKKKHYESMAIYIYRVLKQVHPEIGISKRSMSIMNSFINDIFERIALEASSA